MADKRDPVQTQAYIDDALGRFLRIPGRVDRTYYAWAYLRGMRRLGDDQLCRDLNIKVKPVETAPSDLDLADAEHYMYARFLSGSTGDPATKSLVYGYELVQVVRYLTGHEKDLRTDPAFRSCRHPRKRSHGARKEPKTACRITATPWRENGQDGTAIEANKSFANGQYKNAYIPQRVYPMTGT